MNIVALGRLEGAVLAFGGPCSNLHALRALQAAAGHLSIPPDRMLCSGDVVAYGADAQACIDLMRAQGMPCIAGNCERQLAAGAAGCGCGFDAGSTCDRLSAAWYGHARAQCSAEARAWMAGLPDIALFEHAGRRGAVIHGGVTDIARFLWPASPDAAFRQELDALRRVAGPVDLVIAGHCGLPFQRRIDAVDWVNAGAVGMPPNDGRPQTAFALLDAAGAVSFHRLDYDHRAAAAAMRAAGLTQGYDAALCSGWWPSEEVLPMALRRQGGCRTPPAP